MTFVVDGLESDGLGVGVLGMMMMIFVDWHER